MFRRYLSSLLIVTLTAGTALTPVALATTAEEALFGNGTVAVVAESAAPVETAAPEAVPEEDMYDGEEQTITDYPTLQLGDRDAPDSPAYIVNLQNRLRALGFLKDSADGVYGENTQVAVEQFQKFNNLERTGIADPETQRLMFTDMNSLATPSPEEEAVFGSEAVRVQQKLIEWGFLVGSADGKLGKKSEAAIVEFKTYVENNGLALPTPTPSPSPTPVPTAAPGEMPLAIDMPLITPSPSPTPFAPDGTVDETVLAYVEGDFEFPEYRQTVQSGDKGEEVKRIQTRLKQLNYLYPNPDGAFGQNTARALMYFQRKHGLNETAVADQATQMALFSEDAQKAEEYVFPYKVYVDISDQYVYVFRWDGEAYSIPDRKLICSTGKDSTPTPTGTYQAYAQLSGEWYWFDEYDCYAKWAYGIVGGILFHSVTFDEKKRQTGREENLGRKASHGCVRLKIDDAKWIYDNCPYGTTVVIQE